jgi:hypothetical protein
MASTNRPTIEMITDSALDAVRQYVSKEPETVIGVKEVDGEWNVTVEVLERKAVPDTQDLLGRYEVKLSLDGELLGWRQRMVRKRSDRMVPAEEEWIITG